MADELITWRRRPWPGATFSVWAPPARAPGAAGVPARAPTFWPLVRTVWPSFMRPLVPATWMLGTLPAGSGTPVAMPWSSIGVSHRSVGKGDACGGVGGAPLALPTNGWEAALGYVDVSLLPGALHTVMSDRTIVRVRLASGSVPLAIRAASLGSVTMIAPYKPLNTWLVDEWWCGGYQ